ncbi:hypothetical protein N9U05_00150 [bacterium]|jgi:hypothetical protein|nr:hypothetical protein [bacterium]
MSKMRPVFVLALIAIGVHASSIHPEQLKAAPRGWGKAYAGQPRQGAFPSAADLGDIDPEQDCTVKKLAYEYALELQPHLSPLLEVFEALELGTNCGMKTPSQPARKPASFDTPAGAIFVDYANGADSNVGSKAQPLKTLRTALSKSRGVGASKVIALRAGVHFLGQTLQLTPADNELTIQNYLGEEAWLSGGQLLEGLKWEKYNVSQGANIWVTTLPKAIVHGDGAAVKTIGNSGILGLNSLSGSIYGSSGTRMTRARFPNKLPSAGTMEKGWSNAKVTWTKNMPGGKWPAPAKTVTLLTPNATSTHAAGDGDGPNEGLPGTGIDGAYWTYGRGGFACDRYTPKGGYLCSNVSSGGGFSWENMVPGSPMFPIGLEMPEELFTLAGVPAPSTWKPHGRAGKAGGAGAGTVVQRWTNGWCTTMWETEKMEVASENGVAKLIFGNGGQQTGRVRGRR